MPIESPPFALISAFYFVSWFMLAVVYLLSGMAQVSGAVVVLYLVIKILSGLQYSN